MTHCDQCDFIGPPESGWQSDFLDLHRALHSCVRALIEPYVPFVERLWRRLERFTTSCK